MKRIIYILILLVILVLVVFKLKSNKQKVVDNVYHYQKDQKITVQAVTVNKESIGSTYTYSGTFEPNKETKLSAEIQGKINEVLVDAGTIVTKGQKLIQLDQALLQHQLQSAEVQIEGLEADVKRMTILSNADAVQGVQLEKALLALKSAKVQRSTIQEQINKTTIKAPFSGIVTAKLTEEGAFAAPGFPLLQLIDIAVLKFTINVPEGELNLFKLNQTISVNTDVYPDNYFQGRAVMIGSKANIGNSFPVQFEVINSADLKIKSGMFGRVNLSINKQRTGIIIPASSVISSSGRPQVYKVKNGKAVLQDIITEEKINNKVVVTKGLENEDVIVTSGFINLFNNANVLLK